MVRSMTGFGRHEITKDGFSISAELRSVNHRYLDQTIRLPKKLNYIEGDIRNRIKERIKRGKLEIYISFENRDSGDCEIRFNESAASAYIQSFIEMSEKFDIKNDVTVSTLATLPDVYEYRDNELDEELIRDMTLDALDGAIDAFITSREREGENLKKDLLEKLSDMERIVAFIEERSPQIIEEYQNRLREKVNELLSDNTIDDSRIAAEVVLYADKICVDEEIVRLKSHIAEARRELDDSDEVGRKLDFIAQEMNRESNTILSKSTDVKIADCGIELKTLIEKIREQIQNLE